MPSSKTTLSRSSLGNRPSHLIVGFMGEVGRALFEIFYKANPETIAGIDRNLEHGTQDSRGIGDQKRFDILHVCIPFGNEWSFLRAVRGYQREFRPKITVIHSTVPVGISRRLGAVHSPIRGLHPNLEQGIRTFPKFLGGKQASLVADAFRRAGIKVILCDKQETTEALKLFDTQYYLECVRFCQKVKKFCDKNNLPFSEVYTIANKTYNEGYRILGMDEVTRPVLQPIMTEVGGHCLLPNEELLKQNGKANI